MGKGVTTGVQVVKGASGDMMLVLPVDKKLAAVLAKQDVAIAVVNPEELINLRKCLARYDKFRLRPELVVNPIAEVMIGR